MVSINLTESVPAFERQAGQLGLADDILRGLATRGVTNLGRLAFACGQPGTPATEDNIRQLILDAGRAVTVGHIAVLRRLIFDAQTSVIAQT